MFVSIQAPKPPVRNVYIGGELLEQLYSGYFSAVSGLQGQQELWIRTGGQIPLILREVELPLGLEVG